MPCHFFSNQQSVAVVGSLREGYFGGYVVIKTLLNAGFGGKIYPVNPSYQEVLGLKVYPSIKEIPEKIDLATHYDQSPIRSSMS